MSRNQCRILLTSLIMTNGTSIVDETSSLDKLNVGVCLAVDLRRPRSQMGRNSVDEIYPHSAL